MIMCDEIINAADSVSTNASTNVMRAVSTSVRNTASINFHNKT